MADEEERRRNLGAALRRLAQTQAQTRAGSQRSRNMEEFLRRAQASDEELLDRAIAWLEERWGADRACPYCGTRAWQVGTPLEIPLADGSAMTPAFPVMCTFCGNTVLINAIVAGLVPESET